MLELHANVPTSVCHVVLDICGGIAYEVVYATLSITGDPFDNTSLVFYVVEVFTYVALEFLSFITFLQFTHLVLACNRLFRTLNQRIKGIALEYDDDIPVEKLSM